MPIEHQVEKSFSGPKRGCGGMKLVQLDFEMTGGVERDVIDGVRRYEGLRTVDYCEIAE
jgi:hypothetical protein